MINNINNKIDHYLSWQASIFIIKSFATKTRILQALWCVTFLVFLFSAPGCKKFLEIDPPAIETDSEAVFENDNSAESAVIGMYSEMRDINSPIGGGRSSFSYLTSLSSDDLMNFSASLDHVEFNSNSLSVRNGGVFNIWEQSYRYIFYANSVLTGLSNSEALTESVRNRLEGEAKFLRAFLYFYLVNLFGDVPLITATDLEANRTASRTDKNQIYELIMADLKSAADLLPDNYSASGGQKTRVNRFAAQALLARVYLFLEDWANAETYSTMLISNTMFGLSGLNDVFLANSTEAIWQFYPPSDENAREGEVFILANATEVNHSLSPTLINDFEIDDDRLVNWVGTFNDGVNTYYYPYKYKISPAYTSPLTEYSTILRLAEMYLIRSEARAHLNDIVGAQSDLNSIRNRAGLANTSANDQSALLSAIEHERRVEYFTEWGHRWLDLTRTGRADVILAPIKAGWQPTDVLYPIPGVEINLNRNLTQNTGY